MAKKYLSLERLTEYDALIKERIDSGDESTLLSAKEYADGAANLVKSDLLNGAGEAYDTLKELGDLISENVTAIDALGVIASGKADATHDHDDRYYTETEIDSKIEEINGVIDGKADSVHDHTVDNIVGLEEVLDSKVPTTRTINGKTLTEDIMLSAIDIGADPIDSASSALESAKEFATNLANTKAELIHEHNDMYYVKSEVDVKVSEVNAFVTDNYETKLDAETKLAEAKSYTDNVKNDLLNGAGDAYDTLKELGDLIDDNTDAIEALERVATGKAERVHVHEISDVTSLQETLNAIEQNILQKTQVQIITWEADD